MLQESAHPSASAHRLIINTETSVSSGVETQDLVLPQTYLFWPTAQPFCAVTFFVETRGGLAPE